MKAVVCEKYGQPGVLQLKDVPKPVPGDDEVLVKVHAASVNDWDWGLLRGRPYITRLGSPFKPAYRILGCDVAGVVEAVGRNIKKFKPGDEVFGDLSTCGFGTFAEYVCATENALSKKPGSMTFEEVAAVPQGGILALVGLRDKGQIKSGQNVLINGAGGGAGSFSIQLAKYYGAEVTAVDRASKLKMMRRIGADQVIDFMQEDFTKNGEQYDLIFDHAAYHSFSDYKRALRPGGTYVVAGGSLWRILQILFLKKIIIKSENKKYLLLVHKANKDLDFIIKLIISGKIKPVIDKQYPLSEVPEAFRYFGEGNTNGKIVIKIR